MRSFTSLFSTTPTAEDFGKLLLRVSIGGLMLFHGVAKLIGGIPAVTEMVTSAGLPAALAYGVYVGEVIAPLLIIVGLLTRISGLVFAVNMAMAILLGHPGQILQLGEHGEWAIELQLLYLLGALAISLLGPGKLGWGRQHGWLA